MMKITATERKRLVLAAIQQTQGGIDIIAAEKWANESDDHATAYEIAEKAIDCAVYYLNVGDGVPITNEIMMGNFDFNANLDGWVVGDVVIKPYKDRYQVTRDGSVLFEIDTFKQLCLVAELFNNAKDLCL